MVLGNLGAAIGTAGSIYGLVSGGLYEFSNLMLALKTVVFAGILAIYGIVVSVILESKIKDDLSLRDSFSILGAGLTTGLSTLASGSAIALIAGYALPAFAETTSFKDTVTLTTFYIFTEALGLYGLILSLL